MSDRFAACATAPRSWFYAALSLPFFLLALQLLATNLYAAETPATPAAVADQTPASQPAANTEASQEGLIALYDALLDNPTDIALTLEYARLASVLGDYEAAIPPLERLLLSAPNASKIMLELGILYYQLGAPDVAQDYFNDVLLQPDADPAWVEEAQAYLKQMEK